MSDFHKERDGGKVVPLEVVTKYIFDNHYHRRDTGLPVVESLPLEKFVLEAAVELDDTLIERAAKETYNRGVAVEMWGTWEEREEGVRELYREDVKIVLDVLKEELKGI